MSSWLSEKYGSRKSPLVYGLVSLMGFLVMFMEAPNYAVMVVARFVQGISSSVIWVVGLALLSALRLILIHSIDVESIKSEPMLSQKKCLDVSHKT